MQKILSSFLAIAILTTAVIETATAKPFGSSFRSINLSKPKITSSSSTSKIDLTKKPDVTSPVASSTIKPTTTQPAASNYNTYNQSNRVETRSNSILPALAVGAVAGAVATSAFSSDESKRQSVVEKSTVIHNTPYLTVCNTEEFAKAQEWQVACKVDAQVSSEMCPLLSYFRYCKPATPEDVQGLKPAKSNYNNVFLKD